MKSCLGTCMFNLTRPSYQLNFRSLISSALTFSWRRCLSYRNQFIDLLCKSMFWFLYDRHLRHERVRESIYVARASLFSLDYLFSCLCMLGKVCFDSSSYCHLINDNKSTEYRRRHLDLFLKKLSVKKL